MPCAGYPQDSGTAVALQSGALELPGSAGNLCRAQSQMGARTLPLSQDLRPVQRWAKAGQRRMRHIKRRQTQRAHRKTRTCRELVASESSGLSVSLPLYQDSNQDSRGAKRPREEDWYDSEDDETADDSSKPLQMIPSCVRGYWPQRQCIACTACDMLVVAPSSVSQQMRSTALPLCLPVHSTHFGAAPMQPARGL